MRSQSNSARLAERSANATLPRSLSRSSLQPLFQPLPEHPDGGDAAVQAVRIDLPAIVMRAVHAAHSHPHPHRLVEDRLLLGRQRGIECLQRRLDRFE